MSPGTGASQRLRKGTKPRVSCREPCGLMKPAVEKRRRDRINRSIVQLKGLLEREFHSEPNCRLGKAEILERCVSFLRHHYLVAFRSQARQPLQDYNDGYTHGLQEALCFLSVRQTEEPELLQCLRGKRGECKGQRTHTVNPPHTTSSWLAAKQGRSPSTRTLWRPWQF